MNLNYRLILYSAMMTAIIGSLFGWALSYIGRPDIDMQRYESQFYRTLNHRYPFIGAGLGLAAGAGFAVISQKQKQREHNNSKL